MDKTDWAGKFFLKDLLSQLRLNFPNLSFGYVAKTHMTRFGPDYEEAWYTPAYHVRTTGIFGSRFWFFGARTIFRLYGREGDRSQKEPDIIVRYDQCRPGFVTLSILKLLAESLGPYSARKRHDVVVDTCR